MAEGEPEVRKWSDVRTEIKPRFDVVPLCKDGSVQRRLEDARKRLRTAQRNSDGTLGDGLSEIRSEVEELEAEAEACMWDVLVKAIPHTQWRELRLAHPSEDPRERYDAETFVPAAIAACSPNFDSAQEVADAASDPEHGLTTGQVSQLMARVLALNEEGDRVPFSRSG